MTVNKLKGCKSVFGVIVPAVLILILAGRAPARIPEPDNIIYGLPGNDVVSVTLKVDGELITIYTMGENADAGPYYVLRVPTDAVDPRAEGAARPGDEAAIHINEQADPVVTTQIGQRGTVQLIHLSTEDSDGDGLLDVVEEHELGTNPNNSDSDGDTLPDGWEVQNSLNPTVNDAAEDPDSDNHSNLGEYAAASNPWDSKSIPASIVVELKKGFNVVAIPAEVMYRPDLINWLTDLGEASHIEEVMPFDRETGDFRSMAPGEPSGDGFGLSGGEGLIVYAKQPKDVLFSSMLCSDLDLKEGFNLIGISCPGALTAFELLTGMGSENVASIQRFSAETGSFITATFGENDHPVGIDFPIVPWEGYFVYMKQEVMDFSF